MNVATICGAALALTLSAASHAAVMTSSFYQLASNQWAVDLTPVGDGNPLEIRGFTTYFPDGLFADLVLLATPGNWDSIVVQPDVAIPAAGFLDSFVLNGNGLGAGESQPGFTVQFNFLGLGQPGELLFEIVDANYNVLFSGLTSPVPAPSSGALIVFGLGALAVARRRNTAARQVAKMAGQDCAADEARLS